MSGRSHRHPDSPEDCPDSDTESDGYTEMSLDSRVASSMTSIDQSMRSASPVPSVFSLTSSMREQAYRQEHGRGLNNSSDVYHLPADEEEIDRLRSSNLPSAPSSLTGLADKQYIAFTKVMGKYPPILPQIMAEDDFEVKAVLDLGCGSGSWIMDIAREFPHCSAVAVDLVPVQSTSIPENCRIEIDDINLGLEHFFGDFNVVHCQLIASGIRDYQAMIDQISQVLRPGGLIDCTEFPFYLTGPDKQPILPPAGSFHPPWIALWMSYLNRAVRQRGGGADVSLRMYEWISNHPAFEDVVYREFWLPISPWLHGDDPETVFWNEVGEAVREDTRAFLKAGRPLLLGHGLPEEFVDAMERNAYMELDKAATPLYAVIHNVYARKRH